VLRNCETLNFRTNRLHSALYVGEALLHLVLMASCSDVGLLIGAH